MLDGRITSGHDAGWGSLVEIFGFDVLFAVTRPDSSPGLHRHEIEEAARLEPGMAGCRRRDQRLPEPFVLEACRYLRALDLGQVGRACGRDRDGLCEARLWRLH